MTTQRSSLIDSCKEQGFTNPTALPKNLSPWQEKEREGVPGERGWGLGNGHIGPFWLSGEEGSGRLSPSVICVISAWRLPGSEGQ
jgi:hypothetical protein